MSGEPLSCCQVNPSRPLKVGDAPRGFPLPGHPRAAPPLRKRAVMLTQARGETDRHAGTRGARGGSARLAASVRPRSHHLAGHTQAAGHRSSHPDPPVTKDSSAEKTRAQNETPHQGRQTRPARAQVRDCHCRHLRPTKDPVRATWRWGRGHCRLIPGSRTSSRHDAAGTGRSLHSSQQGPHIRHVLPQATPRCAGYTTSSVNSCVF